MRGQRRWRSFTGLVEIQRRNRSRTGSGGNEAVRCPPGRLFLFVPWWTLINLHYPRWLSDYAPPAFAVSWSIAPIITAATGRTTCNSGPARATYTSGFGGNGFRQNGRANPHCDGGSGIDHRARVCPDPADATIGLSDDADPSSAFATAPLSPCYPSYRSDILIPPRRGGYVGTWKIRGLCSRHVQGRPTIKRGGPCQNVIG
jgi:hypothetical protein